MKLLTLAVLSYLSVLVCCQYPKKIPGSAKCTEIFEESECTYRVHCINAVDIQYCDTFSYNSHSPQDGSDEHCPLFDIIVGGYRYYKINVTIENYGPFSHDIFPYCDFENKIYSINLSNNDLNYNPLSHVSMSNLAALNLSANAFDTINLSGSVDLESLVEIDYSHNTINTIENSQDENENNYPYKKLKKINLSYNYLVTIPDAIFYDFVELEYLDLSHNFIDTIDTLTFEGIKNLIQLKLSHNRISDINNSLIRFTKLHKLELSHNQIEIIKVKDFEKLTNLRILDLSFNSIVTIEKNSFTNLVAVSELFLNDNKLEYFEKDTFISLTRLNRIDMSNNNFKTLQQSLFKDKALSFFSVKGNQIEGQLLKGTFDGLSNVDEIDLSNQKLTSVESFAFYGLIKLDTLLLNNNILRNVSKTAFKTLHNLSVLDLSNNYITDVVFDKEDLVNLHSLLLQNNLLTHVRRDYFEGLNSLQFLDLSNNNISQLASNCFGSLRELVNFEISNNPLSGALEQSTFDGLNSLPSLDISDTMLSAVENGSFFGMVQLNTLNLSHSKIEILHFRSFMNTGAIQSIDLSYNRLTVFEVDPSDLLPLNTLFLNNNFITHVSYKCFRGLSLLTSINFAYNNISAIDNEAFVDQNNLQSVDLSFNPQAKLNITDIIKASRLMLSGIHTNITFVNVALGTSSVQDLELSSADIENITNTEVRKLNTLDSLVLSNNKISRVEVGAFSNMSVLKKIDLSHNKIDFIQPGVFKDCAMLKLLNISHNLIIATGYGVFRGLSNLEIVDMSFNNIDNLKRERFYEVPQLAYLIADYNQIHYVNLDDFLGTSLKVLSISGNPIPCDSVVKLIDQRHPPFIRISAITLDEHNGENVNGIRCNMEDSRSTNVHTLRPNKLIDNDKVLYEIRDAIYNMSKQNYAEPKQTQSEPNLITNITRQIYDIAEYVPKAISNVSYNINTENRNIIKTMEKEINSTTFFLQNILQSITALGVRKPEPIPIPKEISNSTAANLIPLINKIKQDFEDSMTVEKQNTLTKVNQTIVEVIQNKMSSINQTIEVIENKITSIDQTISKLINSPINDAFTIKETKQGQASDTKSFVFMETCVGLMLVIMVAFLLYKFYNSGMFIPGRLTQSTRNLPDEENSAL